MFQYCKRVQLTSVRFEDGELQPQQMRMALNWLKEIKAQLYHGKELNPSNSLNVWEMDQFSITTSIKGHKGFVSSGGYLAFSQ